MDDMVIAVVKDLLAKTGVKAEVGGRAGLWRSAQGWAQGCIPCRWDFCTSCC